MPIFKNIFFITYFTPYLFGTNQVLYKKYIQKIGSPKK